MLDDLILHDREMRGRKSMTLFWHNGQHGRDIITDAEINASIAEYECVSAWNKDPVFGVIGIQSGPR